MFKHYSKYFYGNKISDYGLEQGYVDYLTLSKAFDAVLNNDIYHKAWQLGEWEQESGFIDNSEEIEELENKLDELEAILLKLKGEEPDAEDTDDYLINFEKWVKACIDLETDIEELENQIEKLQNDENYQPEIFQWFIVSNDGARILTKYNEIVFYHYDLDMYLWGVTHWGTRWNYVLTDIKLCLDGDETE